MGSAGWRMAHPSCQPRSLGAGGGPCNRSKFLLSLAAGLGCRSRPGATSTNGHQPLCWCYPCLQVHNQPTTQQSDGAHDGRPPPSLDSLPQGRDWQEVPSTWLGLRLLPLGTSAWRAGKSSQPCHVMWENWLFQVSLAPKPLLGVFFFGNVAETPISRDVFLGEAGLLQGKAVSKCPAGQKSCWDPATSGTQSSPGKDVLLGHLFLWVCCHQWGRGKGCSCRKFTI